MSVQGELTLVSRVIEAIDEQINREVDGLIARTTERAAGRIQGLRDAKALFEHQVKIITQQDRQNGR